MTCVSCFVALFLMFRAMLKTFEACKAFWDDLKTFKALKASKASQAFTVFKTILKALKA